MPTKQCSKCNEFKDFSLFNKAKTGVFGLRGDCKSCQSNYNKKWGSDNQEKRNSSSKKYRLDNPQYYIDYRKQNAENRRNYINNRLKNDELFKVSINTRNLIKRNLKSFNPDKQYKSIEVLGCSYEQFKEHIESKWESWMNWDNYGNPKDGVLEPNKTWDLDHIIPLSSANSVDDVTIQTFNHCVVTLIE